MASEEVTPKRRMASIYVFLILLILNLVVCQGNLQSETRMREAKKALQRQSPCVCIMNADPLVLVSCEEMRKPTFTAY